MQHVLGKLVKVREIPAMSSPIYDTFIFYIKNKNLKRNIIKILKKEKIGTKNLPDAVEWHCASYWDHAISKSKISRIKYTKRLLDTAIAILAGLVIFPIVFAHGLDPAEGPGLIFQTIPIAFV